MYPRRLHCTGAGNLIVVLWLAGFLAACSSGGPSPAAVPPSPPPPSTTVNVAADNFDIRYTGRWNFDDPSAPWVAWQGSTVELQFRGSAIQIDIDVGAATEQFRVIVDGTAATSVTSISPGRHLVVLETGLDDTNEHHIVLMKETYYSTASTVYGFEINGEAPTPLPTRPVHRIVYFGDSNMSGTSMYSEKDSGDEGSYYGYPAIVSRMLGAEMHLQAVGGATLDGNQSNTVTSFIYAEQFGQANSQYRDNLDPQIIIVNAGANDIFGVPAANRKDIVKQRYKNVIAELRNVYGTNAHIVLFNAYGWDPNEPANYTNEVVNETGGNLSALLYPWTWEQYHGSMVEYGGQARVLAEHIESLNLGLSVQQDAGIFDGLGRDFDVANGSFESIAKGGFNAFGWRYYDDGVERVCGTGEASDGDCFVRLNTGETVHQGIDATGDLLPGATSGGQQYVVTATIRGNGIAGISADYEQQELYTRQNREEQMFNVTTTWQDYSATFTAPDGTWTTYVSLRAESGDIEFDNIRMRSN